MHRLSHFDTITRSYRCVCDILFPFIPGFYRHRKPFSPLSRFRAIVQTW